MADGASRLIDLRKEGKRAREEAKIAKELLIAFMVETGQTEVRANPTTTVQLVDKTRKKKPTTKALLDLIDKVTGAEEARKIREEYSKLVKATAVRDLKFVQEE